MELRGKIKAERFDLDISMRSGQIFGWYHENGTYYGIVDSTGIALTQDGTRITYAASGRISPRRIAIYLGLDVDLGRILRRIRVDPFMRMVTRRVKNLRLFRQDPWSCLCAYILSANNTVSRIDAIYKRLAQKLGDPVFVGSRCLHRFPSPQRLCDCRESDIRECGAGFRARYILEAAQRVACGDIDLGELGKLSYQTARDLLKTVPGVGDKIADCVLLFAYSKYEAFPVDVWIKRAVEKVYFNSRSLSKKDVRVFGQSYFGEFAGYAQEYIYSYARLHGL